jgi:hypothetical protein
MTDDPAEIQTTHLRNASQNATDIPVLGDIV